MKNQEQIIGHTKSGNAVYNTANHVSHKANFSKADYLEAASFFGLGKDRNFLIARSKDFTIGFDRLWNLTK